jgi:hypothetical protein
MAWEWRDRVSTSSRDANSTTSPLAEPAPQSCHATISWHSGSFNES